MEQSKQGLGIINCVVAQAFTKEYSPTTVVRYLKRYFNITTNETTIEKRWMYLKK
jgi:hypothetical protein